MPDETIRWIAVAIGAYLIGSIPSGLLIGKAFFGIDVRDYGSRRTGATNVLRTLGERAAAAAVIMDVLKGAVAVLLARWLLPLEPWAHVLGALLVAVGHNWPVFIGFRGGRGVLVSTAAAGVLYWPAMVACLLVAALVGWRTRYVSLMSISGTAAAPPAFLIAHVLDPANVPLAYVIYTVIGAVLVIGAHHDNIRRLRAGTEARLGQRVHRTV